MLDASIEQLNICLRLKPSHPFYLLRMSILLEAKGDLKGALTTPEVAADIKHDLQEARDRLKQMKGKLRGNKKPG
jgi:hypothetical protein